MFEAINRRVVLAFGALRLETAPLAWRGNVLRIEATGMCGTDLHVLGGQIAVPSPVPLGHELVGVIERLEAPDELLADAPLAEGDRVLVAPGVSCGACAGCRTPRASCTARRLYGLTFPDRAGASYGGFADYLTLAPGTMVYALPRAQPLERSVLGEPLACSVRAAQIAFAGLGVPIGRGVAVIGAGVVGGCVALLAQMAGAHVVVADRLAHRLAVMRELGLATVRVEPGDGPDATAAVVRAIRDAFGGRGADVAVECAGVPAAVDAAIGAVRAGGRVVIFGSYADTGACQVRPSRICGGDLQIFGTSETYPEDTAAAAWLLRHRTDLRFEHLVSARFTLDQYAAAFAYLRERTGMKPIIVGTAGRA